MTVKELIEYLYKCNPERIVVDCNECRITNITERIDHVDENKSFVMIY